MKPLLLALCTTVLFDATASASVTYSSPNGGFSEALNGPEPQWMALMGAGLVLLGFARRKNRV